MRRRRGRRKVRRRTRVLREVEPRFRRYCSIRGWWPVIITGLRHPGPNKEFVNPGTSGWLSAFMPQVPFGMMYQRGWIYSDQKLVCGGWSAGTLSLNSLYAEHTWWRNRWSASNCGFDLARYLGTKIYFRPHNYLDYIVFIDAEYGDFKQWLKQCMHPAVLITHPQARLIQSIRRGGPRRKLPRMWVPPPSTMNLGWHWMRDIANTGIFAWYVCWIDLDSPWAPQLPDPQAFKWWKDGNASKPPDWVTKWLDLQQLDPADALSKVVDKKGNESGLTTGKAQIDPTNPYFLLTQGPMVLKNPGFWNPTSGPTFETQPRVPYPQVTFFYKSKWQWGGSTVSLKTVCDPSKVAQVLDSLQARLTITDGDLNNYAGSGASKAKQNWQKAPDKDWTRLIETILTESGGEWNDQLYRLTAADTGQKGAEALSAGMRSWYKRRVRDLDLEPPHQKGKYCPHVDSP